VPDRLPIHEIANHATLATHLTSPSLGANLTQRIRVHDVDGVVLNGRSAVIEADTVSSPNPASQNQTLTFPSLVQDNEDGNNPLNRQRARAATSDARPDIAMQHVHASARDITNDRALRFSAAGWRDDVRSYECGVSATWGAGQ
jgi:hypothetical protein